MGSVEICEVVVKMFKKSHSGGKFYADSKGFVSPRIGVGRIPSFFVGLSLENAATSIAVFFGVGVNTTQAGSRSFCLRR